MDIIDKSILYSLCTILLLHEVHGGKLIVILLWALLIALLNSYFEDKRIGLISGVLFCVSMVAEPSIAYMFPVMAYDLWDTKNYICTMLTFLVTLALLWGQPIPYLTFIAILVILACVMCQKTIQGERLTRLVRKTRDDEEERNMLLSERNHHLIEKQDQEIYVATLRERNRIAREIHDNVGHILTRTILQMGALMTIHKKDEALYQQLGSVKENLDVAMNNVRESVHDLHDESVDLEHALAEILESLKGRFACDYRYDISEQPPRNYKYSIVGIVKEAVSNIIKYSRNNQVEVILREHPGMYQLTIRDYTKRDALDVRADEEQEREVVSFGRIQGRSSGIGLQNIQDRVDALHGNMTIQKGEEFKLFITLPKKGSSL